MTRQASPQGQGLARLSPQYRFVVVFTIQCLFVLVNSLPLAILLFALGAILFALNPKKHWKLAATAPISGLFLLFYNAIFSPVEGSAGVHWLIFTVNEAGLARGLVTGIRITGIMLLSFAWLAATPLPQMYEGIAWIRPIKPWAHEILRGIQILRREFVALTQSLLIRGLKWNSIAANVRNLVPLATMIIPRIIDETLKATLANVSHHTTSTAGTGEILLTDVHVRYTSRLHDVLSGIHGHVQPGSFMYLAGADAAGKTTLLRTASGVIPWIMGELRQDSKVIAAGMDTQNTPLAQLCGAVRYIAPDPFASIFGLTVGQEIMMLASDEAEARRALATMGIEGLWNRETTKLSGGQQVRLVLAGALVTKPRILLLDSPMQELDPEGRADFLEALRILRTVHSCTVVVADQFWQEFVPYVTHVFLIKDGQLSQLPTPAALFAEPLQLADVGLDIPQARFPATTPGSPAASLVGVHVTLEDTEILKGVDVSVGEDELLAIIGPNGSGKTTAMLTLAGAIKPNAGKVFTRGRVGYVFQHAHLQLAAMTVADELAFGPQILKWPEVRVQAFVAEGLAWTGLDPQACPIDLHPADQRMLAIASSLADVQTLILDEPTIGLDRRNVERIIQLVGKLLSEGKAVILVTHDMALASQAHRIVTIRDGMVI